MNRGADLVQRLEALGATQPPALTADRAAALERRVMAVVSDPGRDVAVAPAVASAPRRTAPMLLVAAAIVLVLVVAVAVFGATDDGLVVSAADNVVLELPDGTTRVAEVGDELLDGVTITVGAGGRLETDDGVLGPGRYRVVDGRPVPLGAPGSSTTTTTTTTTTTITTTTTTTTTTTITPSVRPSPVTTTSIAPAAGVSDDEPVRPADRPADRTTTTTVGRPPSTRPATTVRPVDRTTTTVVDRPTATVDDRPSRTTTTTEPTARPTTTTTTTTPTTTATTTPTAATTSTTTTTTTSTVVRRDRPGDRSTTE